jgi:hypothetical protein
MLLGLQPHIAAKHWQPIEDIDKRYIVELVDIGAKGERNRSQCSPRHQTALIYRGSAKRKVHRHKQPIKECTRSVTMADNKNKFQYNTISRSGTNNNITAGHTSTTNINGSITNNNIIGRGAFSINVAIYIRRNPKL